MSLAAVGNWIRALGRLDPQTDFGEGEPLPPRTIPQHDEIAAISVSLKQSIDEKEIVAVPNTMIALQHAAVLSATPVHCGDAPMRLNAHGAKWTA